MKKAVVCALVVVLGLSYIQNAVAKETNTQVLEDYKRHQSKKHKKPIKKHAKKIERVPMAKLKNCHQRRFWVAPNRIREAKVCEIVK
jgi:hypothetical protein